MSCSKRAMEGTPITSLPSEQQQLLELLPDVSNPKGRGIQEYILNERKVCKYLFTEVFDLTPYDEDWNFIREDISIGLIWYLETSLEAPEEEYDGLMFRIYGVTKPITIHPSTIRRMRCFMRYLSDALRAWPHRTFPPLKDSFWFSLARENFETWLEDNKIEMPPPVSVLPSLLSSLAKETTTTTTLSRSTVQVSKLSHSSPSYSESSNISHAPTASTTATLNNSCRMPKRGDSHEMSEPSPVSDSLMTDTTTMPYDDNSASSLSSPEPHDVYYDALPQPSVSATADNNPATSYPSSTLVPSSVPANAKILPAPPPTLVHPPTNGEPLLANNANANMTIIPPAPLCRTSSRGGDPAEYVRVTCQFNDSTTYPKENQRQHEKINKDDPFPTPLLSNTKEKHHLHRLTSTKVLINNYKELNKTMMPCVHPSRVPHVDSDCELANHEESDANTCCNIKPHGGQQFQRDRILPRITTLAVAVTHVSPKICNSTLKSYHEDERLRIIRTGSRASNQAIINTTDDYHNIIEEPYVLSSFASEVTTSHITHDDNLSAQHDATYAAGHYSMHDTHHGVHQVAYISKARFHDHIADQPLMRLIWDPGGIITNKDYMAYAKKATRQLAIHYLTCNAQCKIVNDVTQLRATFTSVHEMKSHFTLVNKFYKRLRSTIRLTTTLPRQSSPSLYHTTLIGMLLQQSTTSHACSDNGQVSDSRGVAGSEPCYASKGSIPRGITATMSPWT